MRRAPLLILVPVVILLSPVLFTKDVLVPVGLLGQFAPWTEIESEGSNPLLSDVLQQSYPYYNFLKSEVMSGNLPLWNPYVLNGNPFVATGISGVFSPIRWLLFPFPIDSYFEWSALFKLILAGSGIYLYCLRLGLSSTAASAGGLIYIFCGYNIGFLLFPNTAISVLFGFGLWSLECFFQEGKRTALILYSIIGAASYLGGHPESAVLHQIAYLVYSLVRAGFSRDLVKVFCASVLGASLAAIQLAPFSQFVLQSSTIGQRVAEGGNPYFFPLKALPSLFVPYFHGHPIDWIGGLSYEHHADLGYLGIVPLILLALGVSRRRESLALLLLNLSSLAIYFGLFPIFDLFTSLPLLRAANNLHIVQIFQATGAILAALGIERIAREEVNRSFATGVLITFGMALVAGVAVKFQNPEIAANGGFFFLYDRFAYPLLSFLIIGSCFILLLAIYLPKLALPLCLLVVLLSGSCFATGFNPGISPESSLKSRPPVIDDIRRFPHARVLGVGVGTLNPNFGMVYKVRDLRGYESVLGPRTPSLYSHLTDGVFNPSQFVESLDEEKLNLIRKMGASLVLSPYPLHFPQLDLVVEDFPFLYELKDSGRVAFADTVSLAETKEQALEHLLSTKDPRSVVVEGAHRGILNSFDGEYSYRWIKDLPDEIELEVSATAKGLLVLRDSFESGWKCQIDSRPVRIWRTDYLYRGVLVSKGTQRIVFRYEPWSFRLGGWVSSLSLIFLVLFSVWNFRNLRRMS